MSAFAPSHYETSTQKEAAVSKLTQEEIDKLQEIHELINLMLKELAVLPNTAGSYAVSVAQTLPFRYPVYPLPWGVRTSIGSPQVF